MCYFKKGVEFRGGELEGDIIMFCYCVCNNVFVFKLQNFISINPSFALVDISNNSSRECHLK